MRLVWLGVKNPLRTDRCRHGSVYQNVYNSGAETRRSEIVREATNYKELSLYKFVF